jgi:hypothetical protein
MLIGQISPLLGVASSKWPCADTGPNKYTPPIRRKTCRQRYRFVGSYHGMPF